MGIWTSSALVLRLIRSTVLVPATPTHSVAPSGVRLPFNASVAPAGNGTAPALNTLFAFSHGNHLVDARGQYGDMRSSRPTSNWCAVNASNPEIDKVIAVADIAGTIRRSNRDRRRKVGA